MKKIFNIKKGNTFYAYLFLILLLEILFKILVFGKIGFSSIVHTFIFTTPIIILLTLLTNFFKPKIDKILFYISIILITIYFIFQYVFYQLFSVAFSFNTIGLADQAADFTDIIIEALQNYWLKILILLIPLIIIIIFRKKINCYQLIKPVKIATFVLFLILVGISYLSLLPNKNDLYSCYNLYFKLNAQDKNIEKFGLLTATRLDIKRVIIGFDEQIISSKGIVTDSDKGNKDAVVTYNKLDIDFESLRNSTNSDQLKNLYSYFENANPSKKNEYTGMFAGKNLIFILAEGFNEIAVTPELTPTLYKLINNGFVFSNYYSPVFLSTTGGEFQATTGLIPNQEILKDWKANTPTISYALGNSFKKIGYDVQAYHDWTYSYYNRNKTMHTLGFDNYLGCKNGLEKEMNCSWLPSDVDLMNVTVPKFVDEEHFMTYYISVSGHAPYYMTSGNSIAYKNKDLVKDLPYSDKVKAYVATQIEFDRAIENLINQLDAKGKLDDTVIVITGDHYPYTLTNSEVNEISKYERDDVVEVNHSNLIIWNNAMKEPIKIDKVGSQIDVLPTVLNLFGVEYDSRLIIGRDILSDYPGLAIFSNRSWVSDEGTYFASSKKFVPKNGKNVDDEYIKNMNVEVANRFTTSGIIIKNNAYKKIIGD